MAIRTVAAGGGDVSGIPTWEEGAVPVDGDTVVANGGSGSFTQDVDWIDVELVGWGMIGFVNTYAMGANDIDVDGNVDLAGIITADPGAVIECAGGFIKRIGAVIDSDVLIKLNGTGNITCNDVSGGAFEELAPAVTHTLNGDFLADGFTLTSGEFDMDDNDAEITGDLLYTAGTLSNSGTWTHTGTFNASWSSFAQVLGKYVVSGSGTVITRTAQVVCRAALIEAGATLAGASSLRVYKPSGVDFLEVLGTATAGKIQVNLDTSLSNSKQVLTGIAGVAIDLVSDTDSYTWTQTAALTTVRLSLYSSTNTKIGTMALRGSGHVITQLVVGDIGNNDRNGKIDLASASVKFGAGGIDQGDDDNTSNEFGFADGYLELAATLQFLKVARTMAATCVDGACHVMGGTIENAPDPGGKVHCHGTTLTACHANYDNDVHAPPCSMLSMGCGV